MHNSVGMHKQTDTQAWTLRCRQLLYISHFLCLRWNVVMFSANLRPADNYSYNISRCETSQSPEVQQRGAMTTVWRGCHWWNSWCQHRPMHRQLNYCWTQCTQSVPAEDTARTGRMDETPAANMASAASHYWKANCPELRSHRQHSINEWMNQSIHQQINHKQTTFTYLFIYFLGGGLV